MYELPTDYQKFIHLSRYSRFSSQLGRRETWGETVQRLVSFFDKHTDGKLAPEELELIHDNVVNLRVLPSMRTLMTAGPALERDHVAGYNCSYIAINNPRSFDEILYILMCGTGVGFSVERQEVTQLPDVPDKLYPSDTAIVVLDSKIGWAKALKQLITLLYAGEVPNYDTSRLRPAGAILKTFGGRSSGPKPLEDLFKFVIQTFKNAQGRKLTSLECHDIVCKIGEIVVVGGVRRSALISLSNLSDLRMRDAKAGEWWVLNGQRALANNSAAYTEKPEVGAFMEEWLALYKSRSGERGIFNRKAAKEWVARTGRNSDYEFGINPCGEIILRSQQFCNLTEAVARESDTDTDLEQKIKIAAMLGTIQSTLTDFRYLRKRWKDNCEEERLLGVSITGIMDSPLLSHVNAETKERLQHLKEVARATNKEWAERLGITPSAAITCVKPSGTASQLADSASGIHPRYAHKYIRRVRQDIKDPITHFMIDKGFPYEKDLRNSENIVFSFVLESPQHAIVDEQLSAIDCLEHWKMFKEHYCEHNPSTTINVGETEWPSVGAWVWNNFDECTGLSFLPQDLGTYQQAPFEKASEKEMASITEATPNNVDWKELSNYEKEDSTVGSQELACVAGGCGI